MHTAAALLCTAAAACATCVACADARPHDEGPPSLRTDVDDATGPSLRRSQARTYVTASQCTVAAADAYESDADDAWQRLHGCVARRDFDDLGALLRGPWQKELRTRPDGPLLVARVIARRGGDVDRDLRMVRRAGMRLYSLRAALAAPDDVVGGLVVMRGAFGDARRAHGARAVELAETRPMTDDDLMFDDDLVHRRMRATRQALHDLSIETGLTVVATASSVFEPATDYVVLLRFEGQRDAIAAGDTTATKAAVGTVVASFESESTLMAGR